MEQGIYGCLPPITDIESEFEHRAGPDDALSMLAPDINPHNPSIITSEMWTQDGSREWVDGLLAQEAPLNAIACSTVAPDLLGVSHANLVPAQTTSTTQDHLHVVGTMGMGSVTKKQRTAESDAEGMSFDVICPSCNNGDLYNRLHNPSGTVHMLPGGAGLSRRTFVCKRDECLCTWSQRMRRNDEFANMYSPTDKNITYSKKRQVIKPDQDVKDRSRLPVVCPVSLGGCNRAFVAMHKSQIIYRIGGVGSTGARNAFLCQSDKGGCGLRWAQRIYVNDGEHCDTDPRCTHSKAKATWEKPKRVQKRKRELAQEVPVAGAQVAHVHSFQIQCAGCRTVLPEKTTDVATQCSCCFKWYCDSESGYHFCSSTIIHDPSKDYAPVCLECSQ